MANVAENATWEDGVYQLEENDPVHGGPDGIDNLPHKNLANRTLWLRQQLEATDVMLATHTASRDHPAATTSFQGMVALASSGEGNAGTNATKAMTPVATKSAIQTFAPPEPAATTAAAGVVELATVEEAGGLADTNLAITPAALAAFGALSTNVLINSSFAIWSFGTTIAGTGSASSNWIADGWSISSDADYVARQSTGRPGSDASTAIEVWRTAAGAQNLTLQQSVEAADCSGLVGGFTLSGWFYNNLGVAASASLVVYVPTSGVANDWSAGATNVFAQSLGQVEAGQWGYLSKVVLPDGWSPSKGIKISINVNAAYLTGPTKTFKLAELKVERGQVATPYVPPLMAAEVQACRRRVQRVTLHLMTSTASGQVIRTGASLPTVMRRTPDATIITDTSVNCGTPTVYAITDRSVIVSGVSTNSSITRIAVELRLNADV